MSFSGIFTKAGNYCKLIYYRVITFFRIIKILGRSDLSNVPSPLLSMFSYSLGWVTGLIILRANIRNAIVRFNAWQSIITFGILSVTLLVPFVIMKFVILSSVTLGISLVILYWLIIFFTLYLWLFLMHKSYHFQEYKLFKIGDLAWSLSVSGDTFGGSNALNTFSIAAAPEKSSLAAYPGLKQRGSSIDKASPEIFHEIINSIATLYKSRDPYTTLHQERVAQLACAIAAELNYPADKIEGIKIIATIHDIGKIAVPTEILSKSGILNQHEMNIIKTHPEVAFSILKGLQFPWPVARAVLQHHERLNGSGYPKGLSGDQILPESRILSVSDVVEAMATHRPYRPALGIDQAMYELIQGKGTLYDPEVVDACIWLLTEKGFTWNM